jgi:hypothetical protein
MIPPDVIDGTDDVPQMSRSDNIWSQCVLSVGGMPLCANMNETSALA